MKKDNNNQKLLKDKIFDNEEILKTAVSDEIELAFQNYKKKLKNICKKFRRGLQKRGN